MQTYEHTEVSARIGRVLSTALTSGLPGPGAPQTGQTPLGDWMSMDLFSNDDAGLKVTVIDPLHREQPIPQQVGDIAAEWNWDLQALATGTYSLELKAYVYVKGQNLPVQEVKALTHVVPVEVDLDFGSAVGQFIQENWKWLWVTILVPLIAAGLAWIGRRRKTTAA